MGSHRTSDPVARLPGFVACAAAATLAAGTLGGATERLARRRGATLPSIEHSFADLAWKAGTFGILLAGFRCSEKRWPTLTDLGWRGADTTADQRRDRARMAGLAAGSLYGLSPLVSRLVGKSLGDPAAYGSTRHQVRPSVAALELAVRYPVTVFVEESFFRGWLQPRLPAQPVVSGVFFATYHLQQPATIPSLMPVGVSLGLLRWWRGSVWVPALVHYLGNAAFFTITYLRASPEPTH